MNNQTLTWNEFTKVEMRVGEILTADFFKEAQNPAYKMTIYFGKEIGILKTSAQITTHYTPEKLIGKQIIAVVNFPPKQIANIMSQCLVLGALGNNKDVILLNPERRVENGTKIA